MDRIDRKDAKDRRERRTVDGITFVAWPEFGGWYEEGHDPASEETGYLYAPMHHDEDGFLPDDITEVEVPYSLA